MRLRWADRQGHTATCGRLGGYEHSTADDCPANEHADPYGDSYYADPDPNSYAAPANFAGAGARAHGAPYRRNN